MLVKVTRDKVVIVNNDYIVNQGEYNINACNFVFSEEYTQDLVLKAVFNQNGQDIEQAIIHDGCDIPVEFLNGNAIQLRVYAYKVENGTMKLIYSPTPTNIYLRPGSYRGLTGSGEEITATQFEQYEQALHDGLTEVENVDINVSKSGTTTTVEITNRNGVTKTAEILDGKDGINGTNGIDGRDGKNGVGLDYNWDGTSLGIKREDEEQYDYVDLKGDCQFATFEINLTTGNLEMNKTDDLLLDFEIENGYMVVII